MPLSFNGEILDPANYKDLVKARMPKGKSKMVTFAIENARPSEWINDRGQMVRRMTAEYSIYAHDTVKLAIAGKGEITGILQYYKTNNKIVRSNTVIDNFEPTYINFAKNTLTFDASKDEDLFFFLLVNSKNKDNNDKYGGVPEFHQVKPVEIAKRKVADIDLEIDALTKLKELKSNKKQLRAFYEAKGHMDWDEHISKEQQDWDTIMAPLYDFCKKNPKEALEMMGDAGLELASKVVICFNKGILKQDGTAVYWGDGFRDDLDGKKRKITNIPKGRTHDWMEWFTNNFLRSEVDVMQEVNTELGILEARNS